MKKSVFQCALLVLLVTAVSACKTTEEKTPLVHAHRGGMALYPENTIPAMIHAVSIGAPVLELDLVAGAGCEVGAGIDDERLESACVSKTQSPSEASRSS